MDTLLARIALVLIPALVAGWTGWVSLTVIKTYENTQVLNAVLSNAVENSASTARSLESISNSISKLATQQTRNTSALEYLLRERIPAGTIP